ncbi:MAG: SusC/RagA family TonB-linked outer membrane protein [Muribaculaceae bacterium]|nr:SusC/RagA family TonB-linked outer membrane protein [Muribaculaceae bacterium]
MTQKKIIALVCFLTTFFTSQSLLAQDTQMIRGLVLDDENDEPLIGVTVGLYDDTGEGFLWGTSTDVDGKFVMRAPQKEGEIRISYIGYEPAFQKVTSAGGEFTFRIHPNVETTQEVVVTGFFNKNKNSFTGAVQQMSGDELKSISGTNIMTAIAALTPGLDVVKNTAQGSNPNNVPELVLRGMTSFSNNTQSVNQPTIILDGVEVSTQELYDLNMNEIESVTVLKDASAAALYGSKAANGVIVITRKKSAEGKMSVSYSFTGNFEFPDLHDYKLLSPMQKLEYERMAGLYTANSPDEINSETGVYKQYELDQLYNQRFQAVRSGVYSDWLAQPLRNSFSQDHALRLYGGSQNVRYEITARFADTKGVMKGDYRRRINVGYYLDYYISNKLLFSNRGTYVDIRAKDTPYGSFSDYATMNPYDPMYNLDGSVNTNLSWDLNNPLYEATLGSFSKNSQSYFTNTTNLRWDITKEWRVTGQFSVTTQHDGADAFTSPNSLYFKNETDPTKKGSYTLMNGESLSLNANAVGTYNHQFGDNSLVTANVGWELNYMSASTTTTLAEGFFNDNLWFIGNASSFMSNQKPVGTQSKATDVGFFVNGTYMFRGKYMIDAVYRATGSSKFGTNNPWGHFWSAGIGWNMHNEKWLQDIAVLERLKLRANAGYTGKVSFSPFQAMTMYEYKNEYEYLWGIGAIPITIGNPDLSWERTLKYNVGADLSMFNSRLNFTLDFYLENTQDLLLDQSKAPSTGVTSAKQNIGELQNKGFEFQIDGFPIRTPDFYWQLGATGYANRNKIMKINSALEELNKVNQENQYLSVTPLAQYAAGESTTAIKVVRSGGIDPATGKEIYIKLNGERTFEYDPADKYNAGDSQPKFSGTFRTALYWKGWSLSVYLDYTLGGYIYNATRATKVEGLNPIYNADVRVFEDRWKQPGDVAIYRDIADSSAPKMTDRFVEKENTMNLTSINFGYEFPQKLISHIRAKSLWIGINVKDIVRFSTVKIERGTYYPYSRGFEIDFNIAF